MGNFEKLVVLTVLFLSAIVLAVQLNDGDDGAESSDPSTDAALVLDDQEGRGTRERGAEGEGIVAALPGTRTGGSGDAGPSRPGAGPTLLDSGAFSDESARAAADRAQASPYGPDCIVLKPGLREAGIAGMLLFDLPEETTWEELALELYGDDRYVALLQNFNEEMVAAPEPGEILVPTRDNTRGAGITGARRPRFVSEPPAASGDGGSADSGTDSTSSAPSGRESSRAASTQTVPGRKYVVRDGDSLSKISEQFYGTKHRWKEIYEANRNVLDSPDWVKGGMTLVIPGVVDPDAGVR